MAHPPSPISWASPENPDNAPAGYGYITDANANVSQFDAYQPYGELLVDEHSSSEDLPYKFNGKEFDEETELYFYGVRYMNPITSMWYGVAPLAEKYQNIGSYFYCHDHPVILFDLSGMSDEDNKSAFSVTFSLGFQAGLDLKVL